MSPRASEDDSKPRPLNSTPGHNTLRRCWGALKETVDALGAVWDAYDNDAELPEANTPCRSDASPPSTPTSPKRPSLDIFKTPPSRPAHASPNSYRCHYDTLTNSPTTPISSRRRRKTNPRSLPHTPTRRRNQIGNIDHSYSTDEDDGGPHVRLLDRLFYQGPPQALDDKVCVFACPHGDLTDNTKPNDNDDEKELPPKQLAIRKSIRFGGDFVYPGDAYTPPVDPPPAYVNVENELEEHDDESIRAHRRDALAQPEGRAPLPQRVTWAPLPEPPACPQGGSMENSKPRDDDSKKKVTFDQPETPSTSGGPEVSIYEWLSAVSDDVDRASLEQVCSDRSLRDQCANENLSLDDEDTMPIDPHVVHETIESGVKDLDETRDADVRDTSAQIQGEAPVSAFSTTIAEPLRHITKRAVSKIPTAKYDLFEAWARQAATQGDILNTGALDGTLPTRTPSGTQSLYADSDGGVPSGKSERIDAWRDRIVPLEVVPNEALQNGKRLHMPRFETRKRRLQRQAASCVILSAAVPPECDTTDLLTTPFVPWGLTEDCELSGMAASRSEDILMLTFGVACDLSMADNHPVSLLPSGNDVMTRSAAMGSMVKLESTDAVVRHSVETASRARLATADDRNLWWHCVNNAKGDSSSFCWSVMLDMCELPPDFLDDDDTKAPVNRAKDLYRTIYDFYNMHHGDGSDMNAPQKFTIHNCYMQKLELHTRSVWKTFMSRWNPDVKRFPPANPVTAAAEAYTQLAIKDHPRCGSMFHRNESAINALSKYVTYMPKNLWRRKEDRMRFVLDNSLKCSAQLVFIRCQAMRFEVYLVKHPDVVVPAQLP
jgi:hypothetical protein